MAAIKRSYPLSDVAKTRRISAIVSPAQIPANKKQSILASLLRLASKNVAGMNNGFSARIKDSKGRSMRVRVARK